MHGRQKRNFILSVTRYQNILLKSIRIFYFIIGRKIFKKYPHQKTFQHNYPHLQLQKPFSTVNC